MNFIELIEKWISDKKLSVKQTTLSTYVRIIEKHIKNELGYLDIERLNKVLLNEYVLNKLDYLSPKYVTNIVIIINSCLSFALEEKYIVNPIKIKKPRIEKKHIEFLNNQEQKILVENILCHTNNYKNMGILIALFLGVRVGELCALKWENINDGMISITKTVQRIKNLNDDGESKTKVIISSPKSQNSIREIPITKFLFDILLELKLNSKEENYILTNTDKYLEPRNFEYYFTNLLKSYGIRHYNVHALRHTFANNAIESNVDIKTISELLGHSDIETTLRIYIHSLNKHKISEVSKMNTYITNNFLINDLS